jgi:SAM-dependent methyltransferase
MFFPDRIAGMREARRVLRPGGRFLFNVWASLEDNPVAAITIAALSERHPAHPSWFLERTPHGYRDPDRIRADLSLAGFTQATVETVRAMGHAKDAHDPAIGFCQGTPMRAEIEALEPGGLAGATEAVAEAVAARFGQGPFQVPLQALVAEAVA